MISFLEALSLVEEKIKAINYPRHPQRLYQPIAYLLAMKGKKIRPVLTLLACNLYQTEISDAIPVALAWEIFHNFTLMHDDVMDKADVRRGQATVHKKWNENTAILSGDSMLILAYRYIAQSPAGHLKELLDLFSLTASEICEGQEYDMQFEERLDVSEEEYMHMIRLKTAVLLGACLKSGAMVGGAGKEDQNRLYEFGIHLGIAFQIQDDLLDVYGDPVLFGKKTGGDIVCNKKTYLLVNALNTKNENERKKLLWWLTINDRPEEKIEAVTALYNTLCLREKAQQTMEKSYQKAMQALELVEIADDKKLILKNLAEELLNRKL
ncbi:MAG: polyprenyl synthetase family protein [Candidatus Azobacteroides sp.]|nr:polyprenyl synthetase family protein [Candidatus Azobacteroides sp.]